MLLAIKISDRDKRESPQLTYQSGDQCLVVFTTRP